MIKNFLLLLSTLILFSSCHLSNKKNREQLNINISSDPTTMDPRKGGDALSSIFHFLLFDGLVRASPDGTINLSLAESYTLSEDRTVYTFFLRDAQWSDGSSITAWDFETSWKKILDPAFPSMNAHLLYPIKNAEKVKKGILSLNALGVEAKDEKTFVVTLEHPTPYFLELISFCVFFPVNSKLDAKDENWEYLKRKRFICSGPFTIKKWKHNDEIILVKNKRYYQQDEVSLRRIRCTMIQDPMTALQLYEKGEIDLLGSPLTALPTDAIAELVKKKQVQIRPIGATTFCAFNLHQFPFHNVHMRKAVSFAINREEIIKHITQLDEISGLSAIPPILTQKNRQLFKDNNVLEARRLLQKGLNELDVELNELPEIPYLYSQSDQNHKIALAIQEQLRNQLGLKVKLEAVEQKVLISKLAKRDFFMAQTFWMAQYNDPMNILERFKFKDNIKNYPGWENERYIQLLDQSFLETATEKRMEILEQAERIFIDEMPVAPLYHWNSAFIAKPYVKRLDFAPIGNAFFEKISIDSKIKKSSSSNER